MIVADDVGEKLEEEGEQQQADVHAIHVRIGGHDDAVIAKAVESLLDIERRLEEVKFLVLVNDFFGQTVGVQRFAFEAKTACVCTSRVAVREPAAESPSTIKRAFLGSRIAVAEVQAAIAQLAFVQGSFLGALAGDVADAGQFLPLVVVLLDLLFDDLGGLAVFVQVGVRGLLREFADKTP